MFQKIQITLMMIMKNMCFKQLLNSIQLASTLIIQNQPSRVVLRKRCSKNMQQIYRRTPMPKCDFKVTFQNTFPQEHIRTAASEYCWTLCIELLTIFAKKFYREDPKYVSTRIESYQFLKYLKNLVKIFQK